MSSTRGEGPDFLQMGMLFWQNVGTRSFSPHAAKCRDEEQCCVPGKSSVFLAIPVVACLGVFVSVSKAGVENLKKANVLKLCLGMLKALLAEWLHV